MSKSKGNVIGPDELVDTYGADAVRTYILFMGPADQDMEWSEDGVEGVSRFLRRLWRIVNEVAEQAPQGDEVTDLTRFAHRTIARVTDDIDRRFQFNTPIAAVMELVNELGRSSDGSGRAVRSGNGRLAAAAVCAAHRGGAVVPSGTRAAVGAGVAAGGSGAAGA